MNTNTIALIPVRAGSKGLPGKNTLPFQGKPLYRHAIDHALSAGISHIYISTDIESILDTYHHPSVTVLHRPDALCGDTSSMDSVISHFLKSTYPDEDVTVILLQATSPLRTADDIRASLSLYRQRSYSLVLTVCATPSSVLKYGFIDGDAFMPVSNPAFSFMNRDQLPPLYRPNGAVYVFSSEWFISNKSLATPSIGVVEMPASRSIDIDTSVDYSFLTAEPQSNINDPYMH